MVQQWSRPGARYFKFKELPVEVATPILVLATIPTYHGHWRTYQSLIVVSREMQALVYDACLPYLPIMLHTQRHFDSLCALLTSHPTTVGPRIRTLWLIASITASLERTLGHSMLQKCTRITHIACKINLLRALVGSSTTFEHHDLKHLTLVEPVIPWQELLRSPAGCRLFSQLTHLRISGGMEFVIPEFCFVSLTHLSFTCDALSFGLGPASPFDSARFPVLQKILPTIPYMVCRLQDPKVRLDGHSIDSRMDVLACPKKWKEADIWEGAMCGEKDLWMRAQSDEYLKKSRAFTTVPPGPKWDFDDWDDEGYEWGGETGL